MFHFLYHSVGAPTKLTNALEVVGLDLELLSINCDVSSWLQVTGDRIILNRPGKNKFKVLLILFLFLQNRIVRLLVYNGDGDGEGLLDPKMGCRYTGLLFSTLRSLTSQAVN